MRVNNHNQRASSDVAAKAATILTGGVVRYGLAVLYAFALCYAYGILSLWWGYFGFSYKLADQQFLYIACFIAAIPATLLVPRPSTFAQASAWFLYALVFLPCLLVPVMQYSSTSGRLIQVSLSTYAACVIFLVIVRANVRRIKAPDLAPKYFWGFLFIIWAAMLIIVIVAFGDALQFVGADDIYEQRYGVAENVANPIVRYSIVLLANAINPFLIASGLFARKYMIAVIGTVAQIFLFATTAAKAALLLPLFVVGVYFLADRYGQMRGNRFLVAMIGIFVLTLPLLANYNPVGGGANQLVTLLYLRTLLISGATFGVYEQFFTLYPFTYFSNNNLISLFVDYPFGSLSVGQAVQQFLIPTNGVELGELNANFLATDGIAALGLLGVPFAGAGTAIVLRFLSRLVAPERTMLMTAGGMGFLLSIANTSLLTSLVTGGGILYTSLVFLAPLDRD